eukprot:19357-Prorocentrum_minimum.AAC.1
MLLLSSRTCAVPRSASAKPSSSRESRKGARLSTPSPCSSARLERAYASSEWRDSISATPTERPSPSATLTE